MKIKQSIATLSACGLLAVGGGCTLTSTYEWDIQTKPQTLPVTGHVTAPSGVIKCPTYAGARTAGPCETTPSMDPISYDTKQMHEFPASTETNRMGSLFASLIDPNACSITFMPQIESIGWPKQVRGECLNRRFQSIDPNPFFKELGGWLNTGRRFILDRMQRTGL